MKSLKGQNHKYRTILAQLIALMTLVLCSSCLTGSQISQKCHCDLTSSFCDFGCCCDTDCNSLTTSCFYKKSSYYCPNVQFFKSIKSSTATQKGPNCYYFNKTSTLIDQKSLSNTQRTQFISTSAQIQPLSKNLYSGYQGYKINSPLSIGGKSNFSFISGTGDCLNPAGITGAKTFGLKFEQNAKISCNCNSCGTPLLFSDILGKTVPKYLSLTGSDITIPNDSASTITKLKVNFIIGQYGSQKIKFIQKVTISSQTVPTTPPTRTLIINFIDSDNIRQQQLSASFFPQIPVDMFYPIHIMS